MPDTSGMNVIDAGRKSPKLTKFMNALEATGLAEKLRSEGNYTIFAPSDMAIDMLPGSTEEELSRPENFKRLMAILKYHIVPRRITAAELSRMAEGMTLETLEGDTIKVKASPYATLNDRAYLMKEDIPASNGVIHVINVVLMPQPSIADQPMRNPLFPSNRLPYSY